MESSPPPPPPAAAHSTSASPHLPPEKTSQLRPLHLLNKREQFRASRTFSVGKLAVATFNFFCAMIALGLSIGLIVNVSNPLHYAIVAITMAATAMASIIWQLAEYLTLLLRRSILRPIHPGAHIAAHFILDTLCVNVAVCTGLIVQGEVKYFDITANCIGNPQAEFEHDGRDILCGGVAYFDSIDQANRYLQIEEALLALTVFMAVSHFILFVLACVETHRRRQFDKLTKYVYLVAQSGPADGIMYYTQVTPMQAENVNQMRG